MAITDFTTPPNKFLSNCYPVKIYLDRLTFPCVECAYQAAKSLDPQERERFTVMSPGYAKRVGRTIINLPSNWNEIRILVMRELLRQKFDPYRQSHLELARLLWATGEEDLIEGNAWNDHFWGAVRIGNDWIGENILGRLLMEVRSNLRCRDESNNHLAMRTPYEFDDTLLHRKDS